MALNIPSSTDPLTQAIQLFERGERSAAEKSFRQIIKKQPQNATALAYIGEILLQAKRADGAFQHFSRAVKADGNNALAWRGIGAVQLYAKGDYNKAIEALSRSVALNPLDAQTYFLMGQAAQKLKLYDDSVSLFETGLQMKPEHAEMRSYLALSYLYQRRFDDALTMLFEALGQDPHNANILMNGLKIEQYGIFKDEHVKQFDQFIEAEKQSARIRDYYYLRQYEHALRMNDRASAYAALQKVDDNAERQGSVKNYRLSSLYMADGSCDKAMQHLHKANRMWSKQRALQHYKKSAFPLAIKHSVASSDAQSISKITELRERYAIERPVQDPVFIVGFPRSGTTLSGQILNAHPQFYTADEYGALDQMHVHFNAKYNSTLPDGLVSASKEQWEELTQLYYEKQSNLPLIHKEQRFVDKMPFNMIQLPLIYALFPKAKILYIRRHPLDCVLSGYMQSFDANAAMMHFANLDDIARLYLQIEESWAQLKTNIPMDIYEYRYEDLIDDFDGKMREILAFLGAEWHDDIRNFHQVQNQETPQSLTPSRTQIERALNQDSKDRWRAYEQALQSPKTLLADTIKAQGYEL